MFSRERLNLFFAGRPVRLTLFALGLLLMIATPAVAILPGPGGIFVFAAGLALALRNSDWAKRRYVHFKRWQPRVGDWADWGLRRPSAKRRHAIRQEREREEQPPVNEMERTDDLPPGAGFEISPIDPTPREFDVGPPVGQGIGSR